MSLKVASLREATETWSLGQLADTLSMWASGFLPLGLGKGAPRSNGSQWVALRVDVMGGGALKLSCHRKVLSFC